MRISLKTKFISALCLVLLVNFSFAQNTTKKFDQGFRLGFGVSGGVPTTKTYDFALGIDGRLQYDLSKSTSLTFTTGFTNLFVGNSLPDIGFIPAKAGFKAFVLEDSFYVMGEAGAAFAITNGYNEPSFLFAPSIGYANKNFDISLRYEDYQKFNTNQIALRLAYGFKI